MLLSWFFSCFLITEGLRWATTYRNVCLSCMEALIICPSPTCMTKGQPYDAFGLMDAESIWMAFVILTNKKMACPWWLMAPQWRIIKGISYLIYFILTVLIQQRFKCITLLPFLFENQISNFMCGMNKILSVIAHQCWKRRRIKPFLFLIHPQQNQMNSSISSHEMS